MRKSAKKPLARSKPRRLEPGAFRGLRREGQIKTAERQFRSKVPSCGCVCSAFRVCCVLCAQRLGAARDLRVL